MKTIRFSLFDFVNGFILVFFMVSILYPFVYLINLSLSTAEGLNRAHAALLLWPQGFTSQAYTKFLNNEFVLTGYGNTIFRTVVGTAASLLMMSFAAYALSKRHLPHLKIYTTLVIITMFFNGGLIPTYLLMRNLHLIDNRLVLILVPLCNAFYLLVIRNFFMNIPESLEESAKIDGAGDMQIFFKLILPLSMPVLATVGLWQAVQHWNAWFDSLIYITSNEKQVITIFIRRLVIEQSAVMMDSMMGAQKPKDYPTPESMRAAAIMVTTLPILIVYPFIQKYFVKGVMLGAVKG